LANSASSFSLRNSNQISELKKDSLAKKGLFH
jgi:hypothetical protein